MPAGPEGDCASRDQTRGLIFSKSATAFRSVSLFPPIIYCHPPSVFPSGVAVEIHEIAARSMPCSRYALFTAQTCSGRRRRVRQMSWRPNIVEFVVSNNLSSGEYRTPRTVFIIGKIKRYLVRFGCGTFV